MVNGHWAMGIGHWAMGIGNKKKLDVFHASHIDHARCPMPHAPCPMPNSHYPLTIID
ncbi:hypothetical protein [Tolypothrix sp. VBCCA 56010]|uniref:hypothetical protein n=1 Tax=Tolypothrix sp. VBCCA 56010 TaxID=3137731 RepID=UPI003D7F0666